MFVSRHQLWEQQRDMLRAMHSRKSTILRVKLRFKGYDDFKKFLKDHCELFHIYPVVPEAWRQRALKEGFSVGVVHKPQKVHYQDGLKTKFRIQFFEGRRDEPMIERVAYSKKLHRLYKTDRRS